MAKIIDPSGGEDGGEQPKIIVDSDWKAEAQKEKERLVEAEQATEAENAGGEGGLPNADFRGLVGSMATQAMMYLGAFPDEQGRAIFAPEYARHYIDLLAVLEEKTKGNLTEEESKELTGVVHELRVRFVQIVQGVAAAQDEESGEGGESTPPA